MGCECGRNIDHCPGGALEPSVFTFTPTIEIKATWKSHRAIALCICGATADWLPRGTPTGQGLGPVMAALRLPAKLQYKLTYWSSATDSFLFDAFSQLHLEVGDTLTTLRFLLYEVLDNTSYHTTFFNTSELLYSHHGRIFLKSRSLYWL